MKPFLVKILSLPKSYDPGVLVANLILITWATLFFFALFKLDANTLPIPLLIALTYALSFLFIGLFITTHDSMHGSVSPNNPSLNKWIGKITAALYGAFSLKQLRVSHFDHHRNPASENDPDYDGATGLTSALFWWAKFMWRYFTLKQLFILSGIANILIHLLGVPDQNILWFWIVPSIWSSFQLFYFGTYLPHRTLPNQGFLDRHRTRSNDWPEWISFLTCYHFGYHWEHHAFPHLAWWQLPKARRSRQIA